MKSSSGQGLRKGCHGIRQWNLRYTFQALSRIDLYFYYRYKYIFNNVFIGTNNFRCKSQLVVLMLKYCASSVIVVDTYKENIKTRTLLQELFSVYVYVLFAIYYILHKLYITAEILELFFYTLWTTNNFFFIIHPSRLLLTYCAKWILSSRISDVFLYANSSCM